MTKHISEIDQINGRYYAESDRIIKKSFKWYGVAMVGVATIFIAGLPRINPERNPYLHSSGMQQLRTIQNTIYNLENSNSFTTTELPISSSSSAELNEARSQFLDDRDKYAPKIERLVKLYKEEEKNALQHPDVTANINYLNNPIRNGFFYGGFATGLIGVVGGLATLRRGRHNAENNRRIELRELDQKQRASV